MSPPSGCWEASELAHIYSLRIKGLHAEREAVIVTVVGTDQTSTLELDSPTCTASARPTGEAATIHSSDHGDPRQMTRASGLSFLCSGLPELTALNIISGRASRPW